MNEGKLYSAIDVVKFLFAVLLVCAHLSSEKLHFPFYIDLFFSSYVVVVPFFFTTSSFFFFRKMRAIMTPKERFVIYKSYSIRLLKMYAIWSLVYTIFKFGEWLKDGVFSLRLLGEHVYYSIVFSSYSTIWFLPALWVAVSLVYICLYKFKLKIMHILILSVVFYCIGWCGYTLAGESKVLSEISNIYKVLFCSWRNGLFNGFVYAVLGLLIANKEGNCWIERCRCYGMSFLFALLFVVEAFMTKAFINKNVDANYLFCLIPFTYFFVFALINTNLKPFPIYRTLRNMSLLLFLSQRVFITAIPALLPIDVVMMVTQNPYMGLIVFLGITLLFSFVTIRLSKRYEFLNILW